MPYIVKCTISGTYVVSTKSTKIDPTDITWAKVYPTIGGAKNSKKYYQDLYDYWHDTDITLYNRWLSGIPGYEEYSKYDNENLKRFAVIDKITGQEIP